MDLTTPCMRARPRRGIRDGILLKSDVVVHADVKKVNDTYLFDVFFLHFVLRSGWKVGKMPQPPPISYETGLQGFFHESKHHVPRNHVSIEPLRESGVYWWFDHLSMCG